jgi:two-component system, chemotaxis family, response regulator PixH
MDAPDDSVRIALVTDFEGRILEACARTAAALNVSPRALTRRPLDLFVDADRSTLRAQMEVASRGHAVKLKTVLRPRERAPRWATIQIERADSTGTIARLCWQIELGPATRVRKAAASGVAQRAPLGPVLLVDDHLDTLELLGHTLRTEGLTVVSTTRARDALGVLDGPSRPGVIVTDLLMPGLSGWDFIAQVRATRAYDAIPIVVISAVPSPDLASDSVSAVFRKPFDPLDLARALRNLPPLPPTIPPGSQASTP